MRGGTRFRRSTSMRGGKNNGRIPPSQQQGTAQMQDTQADHAAIQQNSVPPITQQDAIPPSVQSTDAPREPSQHTSVASTPNDVDTAPSPSSAPRTNSAVVSTMSRSKRRITVTNKEYVLIYMHSKNVTFFELLIILCLDFEYTFFFDYLFQRFDQSDCARKITSIFKKKLHEDGHSWKNLSKDMLDLYWEEFQVRVNVLLFLF